MQPVTLVLIEDIASEAEIAVRHLEAGGFSCSWKRVDSEAALRRELALATPDLILSDFTLPGFDGLEALELAREITPETPFIFLSGTTATDEQGNIVGAGDIVAQTRQIFRKFSLLLESVGGSLANIVETTDYVLSLDDYKKTAQLRRDLFKGPPWPAATGVVVSGLVRKDALIEIKGIAAL